MPVLLEDDEKKKRHTNLRGVVKASNLKTRTPMSKGRRLMILAAKVQSGRATAAEKAELGKLQRVLRTNSVAYRTPRRRRFKSTKEENAPMAAANQDLTVRSDELSGEPDRKPMIYEPTPENLSKLAAELRTLDVKRFDAWQEVRAAYSAPQLFAVDCSAAALDISEDGHFSGRADVLVSTKVMGLANKVVDLSLTIPARIKGTVSAFGKPHVDSFRLLVGR